MKYLVLLATVWAIPALAGEAETLCAGNPAYSSRVMLAVVQSQLRQDHDAALDAEPPETLANKAVAQGIAECAADMRADPTLSQAFAGLGRGDREVAWDAYNTACADHKGSRGACIAAEVGSARALKLMMKTNAPPGAASLVQTCELVMQTDPAMAEWRQCVDRALAVHASEAMAKRCKLSANWHVAKTGSEAGEVVAHCLGR